ncbi:MAG: hypothetical protein ACYTG7_18765 [Planctomycetota bacterium]|jgi:hypothetical protein
MRLLRLCDLSVVAAVIFLSGSTYAQETEATPPVNQIEEPQYLSVEDEEEVPLDPDDYDDPDTADDGAAGSVKGGTMLHPRVKLNFEVHYVDTNITGKDERDWESIRLKPIFFVKDVKLDEAWGMRVATGFEYIYDFDNRDKGIGLGTDQFAPLVGLAFMKFETKTALIPLVQHFEDVGSGPDVSQTAFRMIALQPLQNGLWVKGDLKLPRDWENNTWPSSLETEFGKMFSPKIGVFLQGLAGIGGDRLFDWGAAIAMRINF